MTALSGRLVVASHNEGKVREIAALLARLGVEPVSAAALGLPAPEETAATFRGNAILKAESAARASGLPALADDSGLEVAALGGAPGVHSARWAGPGGNFAAAMRRVWEALDGGKDLRARFVCVLALKRPDAPVEVFEGEVCGTLVWPPRGDKGFGYDPMFVPEGGDKTFGELDPKEKHAISHRARAFAKLVAALK
jgi:XTP/dITP diphosphohydrolase